MTVVIAFALGYIVGGIITLLLIGLATAARRGDYRPYD
jgi:hypothetical protein